MSRSRTTCARPVARVALLAALRVVKFRSQGQLYLFWGGPVLEWMDRNRPDGASIPLAGQRQMQLDRILDGQHVRLGQLA